MKGEDNMITREQLLKELIKAENDVNHIEVILKEGEMDGAKYLMELFRANKIFFANGADRLICRIAELGWDGINNGSFIIILFPFYGRTEFAEKMWPYLESARVHYSR